MESFITEIKRLRIPRPKYDPRGTGTSNKYADIIRPPTPPRDYDEEEMSSQSHQSHQRCYHECGNDYRFPELKK